jgi:hypothetical protein
MARPAVWRKHILINSLGGRIPLVVVGINEGLIQLAVPVSHAIRLIP